MASPNPYSGMPFSRDDALRRDNAAVMRLRNDPNSRVLVMWRDRHHIRRVDGRETPAPVWHRGETAGRLLHKADIWALLGVSPDGGAHFVVDVSVLDAPDGDEALRGGEFVDLRAIGPLLSRDDGAVMAYARGLVYWQRRHRFCGVCGNPCVNESSGHVRRCSDPDCNTPHFPRTDPAVIVLVTHGDDCLLGRQRIWPPGMHSTLAGFVEPGESLEEAVIREVHEEAGVVLREPVYQSSQPWPFPASLMLGFRAEAESRTLAVDEQELDDAAWYSRAFLRESPENTQFRLPRRDSIARRLIEDWLAETGG